MDEQVHAHIQDEALDWTIRVHGPEAGAAVQAELGQWIARSEAHARAWGKAQKSWALMNSTPPVHQDEWEQAPRTVAGAMSQRSARPRWMLSVMAASAACLALLLAAPAIWIWAQADYSTGKGEVRQVKLADGSILHLDSGSAIRLDYEGARRGVTLLAGQAFFDVAHDKARPFVVHAGDVDVRVLGTAFDVGLDTKTVDVSVQRGAVRVERSGNIPLDLRPGDSVQVGPSDAETVRSVISPSRIAAWRDGQIIVNGATVVEVVTELRRYHRGFILLRNERLASRRVTGAYDINDPEAALRAIVHPYGGEVGTIGGYLMIVS
ncbi:FecR family protein [Novosphingobium resinovorum]|uniref:FecR family protein n=1 Tax=Novosphingobium resinovorum TaxID=158500 RepID=UPI002ED62AA4|nr:FecR domain-containing protein [Novosphingobium resinovorum]